eukprot:scaffold299119_cov32-Tisochrysis_lutea.AAC.3
MGHGTFLRTCSAARATLPGRDKQLSHNLGQQPGLTTLPAKAIRGTSLATIKDEWQNAVPHTCIIAQSVSLSLPSA